ncbi:MAG: hypothetical protein WA890_06795 [Micromonospora sp.]
MSRLNVLPADEPSAGVRGRLDQVGAQFGFVPNMFTMLASNPTVLDLVMTVQTKASKLPAGSLKGGMSVEDIELARAESSVDPKRAAVARFAQRVIETRGRVSDADLAAVQGAGYTDPQILATVTLVVRALLTNYLNNVNLTDVDIPAPDLA